MLPIARSQPLSPIFQEAQKKAYFICRGKANKLILSSSMTDIPFFSNSKDVYLGTVDIAKEFLGHSDSDFDQAKKATDKAEKKRLFKELNKPKKDSVFDKIKNFSGKRVFFKKTIGELSFITKQNYQLTETQTATPITINITKDKIDKWQKSLRIYFSKNLTTQQKKDLIKTKARIQYPQVHNIGHLSTFMVESEFYYNSKNQVFPNGPLPIKILGFCYPDFRYKSLIDADDPRKGYDNYDESLLGKFWDVTGDNPSKTYTLNQAKLTEEIFYSLQINLLAVIEEAIKTKQKLPFILNIPSAFLAFLGDEQKYQIKKTIADQLNSLKQLYSPSINEHISEFIALGGTQAWDDEATKLPVDPQRPHEKVSDIFKKQQDYHTLTHVVDADMLEIVEKLYIEKQIICPVPMMANPSHLIGCQYLETDFTITAFDEMIARATGGSHRAIYENGVVNIIKDGEVLKSVERDRVFRTFKTSNFERVEVQNADSIKKTFYVDQKSLREFELEQKKTREGGLDNLEVSSEELIKHDYYQHSFTHDSVKNIQIYKQLDTVPIFTSAIKKAVIGLNCFEDFENDITQGKNLFNILDFANNYQGVGNKEDELRKYLKEAQSMTQEEEITRLISQAKILSARFQKQMSDLGIMTGRYQPRKIVGARLHRMATKQNIFQLMQTTKYHQTEKIEDKFKLLRVLRNASNVNSQDKSASHNAPSDISNPSTSPAPKLNSGGFLKSVGNAVMRFISKRLGNSRS